MPSDRLQRQRFELKYRVGSSAVGRLREFLRCHLEPDPFGRGAPDGAYAVRSVYLDSPDLALCRATINGDKNRYKLRLRYYAVGADAPAFLELKRRDNDSIHKRRSVLRPGAAAALLGGEWPEARHLALPDVTAVETLRSIWHLVRRHEAAPRALVSYRREAWVSPQGNDVRVTFDREVCCAPWHSAEPGPTDAPAGVFEGDVVVEVKFTERFPRWVGEFVGAFDLVRCSAAKYVDGLACVGEARRRDGINPGGPNHAREFSTW